MRSVKEELIRLTRWEALRWGALGAAALGAGGLVAACGNSSATPSTNTTPRRGGTLEAGA
jgi:hypothetical protein